MRRTLSLVCLLAAVSVFVAGDLQAADIRVDGEVLLLIDVSGSVDSTEYGHMMDGYEAVFRSADIASRIEEGGYGAVAVAVGMWSGATQQNLVVPWMLVDGETTAEAFADAIAAITRPFSGSTGIGAALDWGGGLFADNGFYGILSIIDVSGDGTNNDGISVAAGRASALANVDAVNGLPIGSTTIETYYENNVIGGTFGNETAFVKYAATFDVFESAFDQKISAEVDEIVLATPEPGTFVMFGLGGLGLFAAARRRKKRAAANG